MERKLVPYSVYLPVDLYNKIKVLAKERKASVLIRDAIAMMLGGHNLYNSGYNQALKDAAQVVYDCEEAQIVAIKGKDLAAILAEKIDTLEIKK